jgi:hypothetical protein
MHGTTWMILKGMLSKRSQSQNFTYNIILPIQHSQINNNIDREHNSGFQCLISCMRAITTKS